MKLELTKKDGSKIVVDADEIKSIEVSNDPELPGGAHIIFGENLGRIVQESVSAISAVIGVIRVPQG